MKLWGTAAIPHAKKENKIFHWQFFTFSRPSSLVPYPSFVTFAPMEISRTVAFHTLGCKLNFSETSAIGRQLKDAGYQKKEFHEGDNTLEIANNNNEFENGMYLLNIVSNSGTVVKKITKAQ